MYFEFEKNTEPGDVIIIFEEIATGGWAFAVGRVVYWPRYREKKKSENRSARRSDAPTTRRAPKSIAGRKRRLAATILVGRAIDKHTNIIYYLRAYIKI